MPLSRLIAPALACLLLLPSLAAAQPAPAITAPPLIVADAGDSPVRLESASMHVETGAGIARTTIEMTFRNPSDRVLEGNLQFPLPPGQQISGFALDIDGQLRQAVPVPKARGREVFERIVREGVDPGLLEHAEGDSFRLRIYPFAAGGTRRVRLVLLAPLQRAGQVDSVPLPLAFARGLASLQVVLDTASRPTLAGLPGAPRIQHTEDAYRLQLQPADLPASGIAQLQLRGERRARTQLQQFDGATWFVAEVPVDSATAQRPLPLRVGLLWDSSMSGRQRAHALEFALLDAYFKAAGDIEVDLHRLRDVAGPPRRFRIRNGDWQALRRELESTVYDGATSTDGWQPSAEVDEYLLFGDGLFNYGQHGFPAFAASQRLFAVQTGDGDSQRLAALAQARNGRAIQLRDPSMLQSARAALLQEAIRLAAIEGTGASEIVTGSAAAEAGLLRIAGRLDGDIAELALVTAAAGVTQRIPLHIDARRTPRGQLAALQWARFQLAALQAEPDANRARITALGQRFGLVTPGTSLLVLERAEDYVRFDIPAPPELADAVATLRRGADAHDRESRQSRLDSVARAWNARIDWWNRIFPKDDAPQQIEVTGASRRATQRSRATAASMMDTAALPPPPPPSAPRPAAQPLMEVQASAAPAPMPASGSPESAGETAGDSTSTVRIQLQPWLADSAEARQLRSASDASLYATYLDLRDADTRGTAFYLDAAEVLQRRGEPALAMRVLSNIAEMDLDNPHVMRVLAYRLRELERNDLAVPLLERVLAMRPEEPQSLRDLALACAANGNHQRAIELLNEVVVGDWDGRFAEIELTALAELNALVATSATPLDTSMVDPRLLHNLPLDLRAVLSWDSDNSDMDLWVTDPGGEKAYYGNRLTRQGGRMSPDFTRGYGPEEFALRDARPGTYRVEANFYGDHQQLVTGATTLTLWLSTGFGTPAQQDKRITLRLKQARDTVFVGEFEIR